MAVIIKVTECDGKFFTIEAYDWRNQKIMKTPVLLKQRTKKSIEAVIAKEFKVFNQPVWGGYNVEFAKGVL